jgi:DNA (cytosine-5)-methyltransferase 1
MLTARQFMTVGSLFSGIGGFDLGLERAGMRVEWQVENNDYAREVLKKHWPTVPCHYDVTKIDWRDIPRVDLICGGFPCQPFSIAGKRRGAADDRYLWPEVVRCLDALRPTWFLGENVPGIINLALDQVCTDLESLGYQVWPVVIPACAVDAPHQRKRVWIVAHAESQRKDPVSQSARQRILQPNGKSGDVAHAECTGPQGRGCERQLGETCQEVEVGRCGDVADASRKLPYGSGARSTRRSQYSDGCRWLPEPSVGRVAHGIPYRVDRLRGLGNAVVPQVVEALGRMILEVDPC